MSMSEVIREAYRLEVGHTGADNEPGAAGAGRARRAAVIDSIIVALADAGIHVTTAAVAGELGVSLEAVGLMRQLARSNPAMFERVRAGTAPACLYDWFVKPDDAAAAAGEAAVAATDAGRRALGRVRRGDRVTIVRANHARSRFEIEGEATVLAATPWRDHFLVRFAGSEEIVLRRVDRAAQLLGVESYLAILNGALDGAAG